MSEKVKIKIARNVVHLPAIALRGLVVFPNNVVHFEVGRTKSIAAIEAAMHANSRRARVLPSTRTFTRSSETRSTCLISAMTP